MHHVQLCTNHTAPLCTTMPSLCTTMQHNVSIMYVRLCMAATHPPWEHLSLAQPPPAGQTSPNAPPWKKIFESEDIRSAKGSFRQWLNCNVNERCHMAASWFRLKHELPKPDNEFLFSNHIFCNGFVYMNRTMFNLWAEVFNRFQFLCWTHPTVRRVARSPCDLHTPHTHPLTIQAHPLGFTGAKISWILLSAVGTQKHFIIL